MDEFVDARLNRKPSRGKPFQKGTPGRPRRARNKTTVALEQLIEGQGEAIVSKVVEMALAGNPMAVRLAFERVMGTRRERSVDLALPSLRSTADCASALGLLVTPRDTIANTTRIGPCAVMPPRS